MAEPKSDMWTVGNIIMTKYTFANVDDVLPMHDHEYEHSAVVMSGKFEIMLAGKDSLIRDNTSAPMIFKVGTRHGFRALTAGAMILNVQ